MHDRQQAAYERRDLLARMAARQAMHDRYSATPGCFK
jgi:hypothetical protein